MGETVKKTTTRKPKTATKTETSVKPLKTASISATPAKTPKTASTTTTLAKPRKKAAATKGTVAANGTNGHVTEIRISHQQVAMLAHKFWMERGYQHGHHEEDWRRAERELLGKAS